MNALYGRQCVLIAPRGRQSNTPQKGVTTLMAFLQTKHEVSVLNLTDIPARLPGVVLHLLTPAGAISDVNGTVWPKGKP